MVDHVKNPLRISATLNSENDDNYCFILSILAKLHPCKNNHPNRVSNYRQNFNELNLEGFDFTNGFQYSDVLKLEKLSNLCINISELNFYQDKIKGRHKILPIEIITNESDRFIDLLVYKNHYVLIKKLHIFLGNHNCNYVSRRCLKYYTSQDVLIKHKQQCGELDISSVRLRNDSHLYWKKNIFIRIQ